MLMRVNILTLIPIDEKVILESTKKKHRIKLKKLTFP